MSMFETDLQYFGHTTRRRRHSKFLRFDNDEDWSRVSVIRLGQKFSDLFSILQNFEPTLAKNYAIVIAILPVV